MKMHALVVSAVVASVSSVASATLFVGPTFIPVPIATFNDVLDDSAPTYLRGFGDGFGVPTTGLSASTVRYRANTFTSLGLEYRFTSVITRTAGTGGWQQHLYTPSFDPADAVTNSISSGPTFSWTEAPRTVNYNLIVPAGPITVVNNPSSPTGRGTVTTVVSTDDGIIPDFSPAGRNFTLTITQPGTISSFENIVIRGLEHTYAGDVTATLSNGTITVPLFADLPGTLGTAGTLSADFNGNYTIADGGQPFPISGTLVPPATYAPQSPLSAFVGQPLAGTWTLFVADVAETDTGRIAGFDLNIAASSTPSFVLGDFNFDGGVDASDIDPFVVAANEGDPFAAYIASFQAAFAALYPGQTLTADIINSIGDFNGDGGVDASDIDPFVVFANNGGAVSAIPEPAALGLLAPMGLLLYRRRR